MHGAAADLMLRSSGQLGDAPLTRDSGRHHTTPRSTGWLP
jgi:hypothetical protein